MPLPLAVYRSEYPWFHIHC